MAANWRGNTIRGGVNPFRSSPARRPISITSILLFFVLLLLPLSRKAYCTARKKRRKEEEECALSRPDKREEDLKAWQTAYENPLDTTLKDSSYPLKITITFRYFISFSAPCLLLYTLIYLHHSTKYTSLSPISSENVNSQWITTIFWRTRVTCVWLSVLYLTVLTGNLYRLSTG